MTSLRLEDVMDFHGSQSGATVWKALQVEKRLRTQEIVPTFAKRRFREGLNTYLGKFSLQKIQGSLDIVGMNIHRLENL